MNKFTRQDYMNKVCTHSEYYAQFVSDFIKDNVKGIIGLSRILTSNDKHFNDIPLKEWDILARITNTKNISDLLKEKGDWLSLSASVCILKETAKQLKEENK